MTPRQWPEPSGSRGVQFLPRVVLPAEFDRSVELPAEQVRFYPYPKDRHDSPPRMFSSQNYSVFSPQLRALNTEH